MLPDKTRFTDTVAQIDQMLHGGQYAELERLSGGKRLTVEQIKAAIKEYPEELAPRPAYDFEDLDIIHVRGSSPAEWSVYLHLWRKKGGRSDLTAELTIIDTVTGLYAFQIDNIHVL
jgi:hypothetical protein